MYISKKRGHKDMEKTNNIEVSQEIEKAFKQINHSNMADGVEKQVLASIVENALNLSKFDCVVLSKDGSLETLISVILEETFSYGRAVGIKNERERRHTGKKIANVNRPTFKAKRV